MIRIHSDYNIVNNEKKMKRKIVYYLDLFYFIIFNDQHKYTIFTYIDVFILILT